MKRTTAFVTIALVVSASSPDSDGSVSSCVKNLYPAYNPKSLDQCVAVCQKCDRGVVTTCNTSCSLKGAR
jgi:hypothetical protein